MYLKCQLYKYNLLNCSKTNQRYEHSSKRFKSSQSAFVNK